MNTLKISLLAGLVALLLGHSTRAATQTNAPMDSRSRCTAAMTRATEGRGWSWAYWQFDSDFILYDVKREAWVEPIREALIPKPTSPF